MLKVAISYSHTNKEYSDQIIKLLGLRNIEIIHDSMLRHRNSISNFMKSLSDANFVITIISLDYLHSENCMNELLLLYQSGNLNKKIIPIVVGQSEYVFKIEKYPEIIKFWENEEKRYEKLVAFENHPFLKESLATKQNMANLIVSDIPKILKEISDLKCFTDRDFTHIDVVLHGIIGDAYGAYQFNEDITKLDTVEDRILSLESVLQDKPSNFKARSYLSQLYFQNGWPNKAIQHLSEIHESSISHNDFNILILSHIVANKPQDQIHTSIGAILKIHPNDQYNYTSIHFSLGCNYLKMGKIESAKVQFNKQLEILEIGYKNNRKCYTAPLFYLSLIDILEGYFDLAEIKLTTIINQKQEGSLPDVMEFMKYSYYALMLKVFVLYQYNSESNNQEKLDLIQKVNEIRPNRQESEKLGDILQDLNHSLDETNNVELSCKISDLLLYLDATFSGENSIGYYADLIERIGKEVRLNRKDIAEKYLEKAFKVRENLKLSPSLYIIPDQMKFDLTYQ